MNRFDQEQDELPLRTPVTSSRDREYTLSTGIVLGIFFALALVCSIFFGFGYTLGRKSMQPAMSSDSSAASTDTAAFNKFKPAAGTTGGSATSASASPKQESTTPSPTTTSAASNTATETAPRQTVSTEKPATLAPVMHQAPPPTPVAISTPAPGGTTMVQIAAVSHPEDAEVLTAALKRRGYSVITRQESGDRLIHVQVGPFSTRKDAEVMRQKLLNDGYNAILK
ncbi:MAG: SPOR domain-containing protein [Acidobacteria bacterium]|nr:SPOR domain-containing protein [Acidobacteriota bacterium]